MNLGIRVWGLEIGDWGYGFRIFNLFFFCLKDDSFLVARERRRVRKVVLVCSTKGQCTSFGIFCCFIYWFLFFA